MKVSRPTSRQEMPDHAELVFQGKIFSVYHWQQQVYNGSYETFEKIKRLDTVVVFGVLDDGSVLLTNQEQPGYAPFIGAAGGRVNPGEDPTDAAKRELLEETGYQANSFELWHSEQPTSKIDWAVYVFIAKGLTKVDNQNLDPGEKVYLNAVSFDDFLDVALKPNFSEKEIVKFVYEAKLDPKKLDSLKDLFSPQPN